MVSGKGFSSTPQTRLAAAQICVVFWISSGWNVAVNQVVFVAYDPEGSKYAGILKFCLIDPLGNDFSACYGDFIYAIQGKDKMS